jgi:hypothetical protein
MPYSGGQSTQGGIRFQNRYGALLLARGFWDADFVSLKPEARAERQDLTHSPDNAVGDGIDDLILTYATHRTAISCKQYAPAETGQWSFAQLIEQGVIRALAAHYERHPGDQLVFASMDSVHRSLGEMQLRLLHAVPASIEQRLDKPGLKKLFVKFQSLTSDLDDTSRLRLLRQLSFVQVQRTTAESEISRLFAGRCPAPQLISDILFSAVGQWAEEGATITRAMVQERLRSQGVHIEAPDATAVLTAFAEASVVLASEDSAIPNVPNSEQPREALAEILHWLTEAKREREDGLAVVIGEAGTGKTGVLKMLLRELRVQNVPVLAFKADRVYERSVGALLQRLPTAAQHLPSAIAALVAGGYPSVVVLIDQLDALSQSLSANREYLHSYRDLLTQLLVLPQVKVVVSCRSYDLQADPVLQQYHGRQKIKVGLLTDEQVAAVVAASALRGTTLSPALREVLRVPLNLRIFCQLTSGADVSDVRTLQGLYQALFKEKVQQQPAPLVPAQVSPARVKKLLYQLAKAMYDQQQLSVAKLRYEDAYGLEIDYALSQKLLVPGAEGQLQFFHQSFFDYLYARQFVEKDQRIGDLLQARSQGFFIRSSVRQVLTYLRAVEPRAYLVQLEDLLTTSTYYRYHIRLLACQQFAQLPDPSTTEQHFARRVVLVGSLRDQFLEAVSHQGWLHWLYEEGVLVTLFTNPVEMPGEWALIWMLARNFPRLLLDTLAAVPTTDVSVPRAWRALELANETTEPDYSQAIDRFGPLLTARGPRIYYHLLTERAQYDPAWTAAHLVRLLKPRRQPLGRNSEGKADWYDQEALKKLYKAKGNVAFNACQELIEGWIAETRLDRLPGHKFSSSYLIDDYTFYVDVHEKDPHTIAELVLSSTYHYLQHLASTDPAQARVTLAHWPVSKFDTLLLLTAGTYRAAPQEFATDALALLVRPGVLAEAGSWLKYELVELLRTVLLVLPEADQFALWQQVWQLPSGLRWQRDEGPVAKRRLVKPTSLVFIALEEDRHLYLSAFPAALLRKVSPASRRAWLTLERRRETPRNRKPREITWGSGAPSPMQKALVTSLRPIDWLRAFQKYQNLTGERRWYDYGEGLARQLQETAKTTASLVIPVVELLLEQQPEIFDRQFLLQGLSGLADNKAISKQQLAGWLERAVRQNLLKPWDSQVVRLAGNTVEVGSTTPFIMRWLLQTVRICCRQQRHTEHKHKDDLVNDGINTSGGIAIEALVRCTKMPEFAASIELALCWVGAHGSGAVRAAALYRLSQQLLVQTRTTFYKVVCELVGDDWRQLRFANEPLSYMGPADWLTVQPILTTALHVSDPDEALAGILMRAWLMERPGADSLVRHLWQHSAIGREKSIRFLTHVYEGFDDTSLRYQARIAFQALLPYAEEGLRQAYEGFFHKLTAAEFGDWYPVLQAYVISPAGRGRQRQFYDYLGQCVGRYPSECIQLIACFSTHELPDIRHNGLEQRPLEVLLSAYHVLTERDAADPGLETALNVFDALLQLPQYRTGVLSRLTSLDRY